jgi:hypothetical protein
MQASVILQNYVIKRFANLAHDMSDVNPELCAGT